MAKFNIEIDVNKISEFLNKTVDSIKKEVTKAVSGLAAATHAKTLELADDRLKTLKSQYKDGVKFDQLENNVWMVSLDESIMWIEEGTQARSGYDSLSKSTKAKTSKEGHRYLVIPFKHDKKPSEQSSKAQEITNALRQDLKSRGIPYKKLEYNNDGSPKMGKLHTFDVASDLPTVRSKFASLKGVSIYQTKDKNTGSVRRDIMTFRVMSEKTKGDGRWQYPDRQGVKILDDVHAWALRTWESEILPSLLEKIGKDE